jgi:hypothetical protein
MRLGFGDHSALSLSGFSGTGYIPQMENRNSLPRAAGRIAAGGSLLLGGAGAGMFFAPHVGATLTTYHVSNLNDDGAGSLRDAVRQANANGGADTIVFDAGASGTITLTGGQITITDDVTITGLGETNSTISGNNASRIFYVGNRASLISASIESITLSGGKAPAGNSDFGGAIYGRGTFLTLANVVVSGNSASEGGGLFIQSYYTYYGGSGGSLEITNSVISANSAQVAGGGGGGIKTRGLESVHITGSVISDNSAQVDGGGVYLSANHVEIDSSTIADNSSGDGYGGGLWVNAYSLTMTNSTVSGNRGNIGSALRLYGKNQLIANSTIANNVRTGVTGDGSIIDSSATGSMQLLFSTVSGNHTDGVATVRIHGAYYYSAGQVEITGSVISDNTTGTGTGVSETAIKASDVTSVLVSDSLIMGQTASVNAALTFGPNGITGVSAQLGALAENGGPTKTMEPGAGSPAIDGGPLGWAVFAGDSTDQRGLNFARVVNGRSDMGAVEVQSSTSTTTTTEDLLGGDSTTSMGTEPIAPAFTG